MRMLAIPKRWTVEEVLALPEDGRRYEVIDGILIVNGVEILSGDLADATPEVTPSPSPMHQRLSASLVRVLDPYVRAHAIGELFFAPADTHPAPGTLAQPDLFVIPPVGGRRPREWSEVGRLLLAIEVLSPSSARSDRLRKRRLYQRAGIPEYWIVDPDTRVIERWRPMDERAEVLDDRITWQPDETKPALVIELGELFGEALDG